MEVAKTKRIPTVEVNGLPFIHKKYRLLDEGLKEPLNNGFVITTNDKESFVALVEEYKQENSKVFYNFNKVEALLDFHTKDNQRFNRRMIKMDLEKHPFYRAFLDTLNKPLNQRDFIAFLKTFYLFLENDKNAMSGLDLIDLSTDLSASSQIDSIQKHTSSGFCLSSTIKSGAKEEVEIPSKLTFGFQMLTSSTKRICLKVELFITLKENSFEIRMVCYDLEVREEAVLKEFIKELKDEIALPCFNVK